MSFFKKLLRFIKARYAPRGARYTFATCAEDLIIRDILSEAGVKKISYIDIGAHHPIFGNNTYLFYRDGGQGVLVEPNAALSEAIKSKRPRDTMVNAGAGRTDGKMEFYAFERTTRSTFSGEQAAAWEKESGQKPKISKLETISIDTLISKYFKDKAPDVISIDAEGYDAEILSGFSFSKRPKVFCIEMGDKVRDILESHGYALSVRTRSNSIFVDKNI